MPEDSFTKIEESNERYWNSEKGKATLKKYQNSEKGRASRDNYFKSEKGKASLLRYYLSEKGITTRNKRNELNKLLLNCNKFLEENPTLTASDFLSQLSNEEGDSNGNS